MKKIILTLVLFISVTVTVYAQASKKVEEESNCFIKWAQKFEARGAEEVADGTYSDVIITFRSGSDAECFNGKCDYFMY